MTPFLQRLYHLPLIGWVLRHRFSRFAVVGASGYTGAELSWTQESNASVNRMIAAVGGRRYKTYRIYEKDLVEPSNLR